MKKYYLYAGTTGRHLVEDDDNIPTTEKAALKFASDMQNMRGYPIILWQEESGVEPAPYLTKQEMMMGVKQITA